MRHRSDDPGQGMGNTGMMRRQARALVGLGRLGDFNPEVGPRHLFVYRLCLGFKCNPSLVSQVVFGLTIL